MKFAGSQSSMSDLHRRREEVRQKYGVDYINNPHARGKCWVCHWRPIQYAPESAREYAIWRRRKIPLVCGRWKCHEGYERATHCDYCGDWARFSLSREHDWYLLQNYDVIRCYKCEQVSFDDDFEVYKCKFCGWESQNESDMCVLEDPIEGHVYDPVCRRKCRAVIMDRFARKHLTFDEI